MVRLVALRTPNTQDHTCVWMNAGLLAYKLCDRNFDCEHCPLDAVLRGDAGALRGCAEPPHDLTYPADRLYTKGHTWLRRVSPPGDEPTVRLGLDALAALLVGPPRRVRWCPVAGLLREGDTVCALELPDGEIAIASPIAGSIVRWNDATRERPELAATDPYQSGWLIELAPANADDLAAMLTPDEVRRQIQLDLRRFRRHAGYELLVAHHADDAQAPSDGAGLTDLRRMIGGSGFLTLVRDLVH